jgi:hypothetical protein
MRLLVRIMDYDGLLIRFAADQWCYHVENEKEPQRLVEIDVVCSLNFGFHSYLMAQQDPLLCDNAVVCELLNL